MDTITTATDAADTVSALVPDTITTDTNRAQGVGIDSLYAAYNATPSEDNLRALHQLTGSMLGLFALDRSGNDGYQFVFLSGTPFTKFRAKFDRILTEDEADKAFECIRYAVRDWMGGRRLPHPHTINTATGTQMEFTYHSVGDSDRMNPDTEEMFDHADQFIREGTPIRPSNRAGIGTMGTRALEGIGEVGVVFEIFPV